MDIRVLTYFLAVAREGTITRAAESLHIAQPSLSKQLMELEDELGKQLFIRGKRKITLTNEGLLLRRRAEDIVALVEKTKRDIASDDTYLSGEISIGGNIPQTLLQAISSIQKQYPHISFALYCGDAIDVMAHLNHGNLDFAVLLQPIDTIKYTYIPLPDTAVWGILMRNDSPFAQQSVIQSADIQQIPLIFHRRIGLQQRIADWAHTDIDRLHIAATYNVTNGSPCTFVQHGIGNFLITRDLLPHTLEPNLVFRPLAPTLAVRYNLTWKRQNIFSPPAALFLKKVRSLLAAAPI